MSSPRYLLIWSPMLFQIHMTQATAETAKYTAAT